MCEDKKIKGVRIECFPTIKNSMNYVYSIKDNNSMAINVLITGSIHLVGGSLKIIKNKQNIDVMNERITQRNMA